MPVTIELTPDQVIKVLASALGEPAKLDIKVCIDEENLKKEIDAALKKNGLTIANLVREQTEAIQKQMLDKSNR